MLWKELAETYFINFGKNFLKRNFFILILFFFFCDNDNAMESAVAVG